MASDYESEGRTFESFRAHQLAIAGVETDARGLAEVICLPQQGRCVVSDIVTPARRSEMMSRIRGKGTKPELVVRSAAHRLGFRFRLHVKKLPGSPDLVFPKRKTALFVHGCFWHRHEGCPYCYVPKSNIQFWWATRLSRLDQRGSTR